MAGYSHICDHVHGARSGLSVDCRDCANGPASIDWISEHLDDEMLALIFLNSECAYGQQSSRLIRSASEERDCNTNLGLIDGRLDTNELALDTTLIRPQPVQRLSRQLGLALLHEPSAKN